MTNDTPPSESNVFPLHAPPLAKKGDKRRAEAKYGVQVMKHGYTMLPNLLLRAQAHLAVEPAAFNVLIQLIEHWWDADSNPYPAKDTIARRMKKSPRMIQRHLTALEKAGLIRRVARFSSAKAQTSNGYSFNGLVAKLKKVEPIFQKEAEQRKLRRKKTETAVASGAA